MVTLELSRVNREGVIVVNEVTLVRCRVGGKVASGAAFHKTAPSATL